MATIRTLKQIATLIADTEVWLTQCPLKGDAFYETAAYPLECLQEEAVQAALNETQVDEALLESIRAYVEEGEDNTPDGTSFWRTVAALLAD